LSIGLSLAFASLFQRIGWMPHGGLALAVSVSTALEVTILFLIMRKRLNGIHGPDIAKGFGIALLGSLGMSAVLILWLRSMGSQSALVTALGGAAVGASVYGLVLVLLRVQEIHSLFEMVRTRIQR